MGQHSTVFRTVTFQSPNGMRVTTEVAVYRHTESLPEGRWRECAISDCPRGCKVYVNEATGHYALAHNSNYGCQR